MWSLEHVLRNPRVPRHSKPNLDCIQASRREQQWKVLEEEKNLHPLWLMLVTAVRLEWILQDPERTKSFLCTQVKECTVLTAVKQPAAKQPAAKRVDEIMETVRRATATRQVLLSRKFPDQVLVRLTFRMSSVNTGVFCTGSAMRGPGVGRQEALLLLRDLRAKYKTLHQKMMGQVAGS